MIKKQAAAGVSLAAFDWQTIAGKCKQVAEGKMSIIVLKTRWQYIKESDTSLNLIADNVTWPAVQISSVAADALTVKLWVISCSVQAGGGPTRGFESRTGWSRYLWPLWSRAMSRACLSPSTLIILRADLSARLPSRPTAATWWSANWILNQLRDQEGGNDSITATLIPIRLNHSNLKTLDCDLAPDKEIISVKSCTEGLKLDAIWLAGIHRGEKDG